MTSFSFGCFSSTSFEGSTPPKSTMTRAKRSASEIAYCSRGRSLPPALAPMTSRNRCTGTAALADAPAAPQINADRRIESAAFIFVPLSEPRS
jgi:hypothetical protein